MPPRRRTRTQDTATATANNTASAEQQQREQSPVIFNRIWCTSRVLSYLPLDNVVRCRAVNHTFRETVDEGYCAPPFDRLAPLLKHETALCFNLIEPAKLSPEDEELCGLWYGLITRPSDTAWFLRIICEKLKIADVNGDAHLGGVLGCAIHLLNFEVVEMFIKLGVDLQREVEVEEEHGTERMMPLCIPVCAWRDNKARDGDGRPSSDDVSRREVQMIKLLIDSGARDDAYLDRETNIFSQPSALMTLLRHPPHTDYDLEIVKLLLAPGGPSEHVVDACINMLKVAEDENCGEGWDSWYNGGPVDTGLDNVLTFAVRGCAAALLRLRELRQEAAKAPVEQEKERSSRSSSRSSSSSSHPFTMKAYEAKVKASWTIERAEQARRRSLEILRVVVDALNRVSKTRPLKRGAMMPMHMACANHDIDVLRILFDNPDVCEWNLNEDHKSGVAYDGDRLEFAFYSDGEGSAIAHATFPFHCSYDICRGSDAEVREIVRLLLLFGARWTENGYGTDSRDGDFFQFYGPSYTPFTNENRIGDPAFHIGALGGDIELMRDLIVKAGCDINQEIAPDVYGEMCADSILFAAIRRGDLAMVREAVKLGAELEAPPIFYTDSDEETSVTRCRGTVTEETWLEQREKVDEEGYVIAPKSYDPDICDWDADGEFEHRYFLKRVYKEDPTRDKKIHAYLRKVVGRQFRSAERKRRLREEKKRLKRKAAAANDAEDAA